MVMVLPCVRFDAVAAPPPPADAAYVGGASAVTSGTITQSAVTYSATAGNGVFLTWHTQQSSARTISSVTDQSGNALTYYEADSGLDNSNYSTTRVVFCPNLPSGITGFRVNHTSTSSGAGLDVREFSGLSTAAPQAGFGKATETTATTATDNVSTGNVTPVAQPGILFAVSHNYDNNAARPAAGTGFTSIATPDFALVFYTASYRIEWKAISSTSAVPGTFTNTGSSGNIHQSIAAYVRD